MTALPESKPTAQPLPLAVTPNTALALSAAAVTVLTTALNQLSMQQSLSDAQTALKCLALGINPTTPAYSQQVVNAYQHITGGGR